MMPKRIWVWGGEGLCLGNWSDHKEHGLWDVEEYIRLDEHERLLVEALRTVQCANSKPKEGPS